MNDPRNATFGSRRSARWRAAATCLLAFLTLGAVAAPGSESPRAALRGFLEAGREGRWQDAASALDLAAIPDSERAERGPQLARQLKAVLDADLWINLDAVSAQPVGATDDGLPPSRESIGRIAAQHGGDEILLERLQPAEGMPVWKIASATVDRIPTMYAQLAPPTIVESLPATLRDTRFLEIALWQWIGLIVLVIAAWLAAWIAASLTVRLLRPLTARSKTDLDDRMLALAVGPARMLLTVAGFNAALALLQLSVPANNFARGASKFLVIAGIAWLVMRVIELFASRSKERFLQRGQSGAAHLVPLGARAIKLVVLAFTALATLDTLGFDVTAILAGLGIGGLALALAAQKTVENMFGGVSVLVDQPVRPGDFCRFGDKVGTVEDIGLRSTRIRTLDRTVLSVPNAEFAALQLENFAKRDSIRLLTTLGLRYETTPDQLRHLMAALRALLIAHPKVRPEPLRVRLVGFGAYSLDVEMLAYVDTTDFNEFLAVREDIFLRVMDLVAASGSGFAFPSSTTYLGRDAGLDIDRQRAAAAEVQRLRAEGKLPFPDPSAEQAGAIRDTLDWPPAGSGAAKR